MTSFTANLGRRALSLTLAAAVSVGMLAGAASDASAAVRRPAMGGFHAGGIGRGMEHRGFGHMAMGRAGRGGRGGGFGGFGEFDGGDFGGGRVGTSLAAASLALGIFGAVASAAAEQQVAAQPQCGIANQPVLRPNGTYYYRRVQVCQ